jgi:tetratricopeptide (TPR) repeat protein
MFAVPFRLAVRRSLARLPLSACLAALPALAAASQPVSPPGAMPAVPGLDALPAPAQRHVEEVREALANALEEDPRGAAAAAGYTFLGRMLYAYELPAAAETALSAALERAPGDLDGRYLRGLARAAQDDHSGAAADFGAVAEQHREAVAPELRLGDELLALGDAEAAREAFAEALRRRRPNPAAEYGLGRAELVLGDAPEAVRHLEAALAGQPSATVVHADLAAAYQALGDTARAREHLAELGEVPFSFPDPVLEGVRQIQAVTALETVREMAERAAPAFDETAFLDFVLHRFGKSRDPIFTLRSLVAEQAERGTGAAARGRLHYAVGGLLLQEGRSAEAIPELERAVELAPELRDARLQLANALAAGGRLGDALVHYDTLLALEPDDAATLVKRAAARANLAGGAAAPAPPPAVREDLERAVAVAAGAGDGHLAAEAHGMLGQLDRAGGDFEAAIGHYREALAADPEHAATLEGLARLLGDRGEYREAADLFRRLSAVAPRDPDARMGAAVALLLAADYASAREGLEQAVAELPDDVALKARLARLLASSPDRAVRDGARAVTLAQELFAAAPTAEAVETLAMAFAEAGDFEAARLWQNRLLASGGDGVAAAERRRWQANLELYSSGRSCCAGLDP